MAVVLLDPTCLRLDFQELAGPDDRIQQGGAPASLGMPDCDPVLSSESCGSEAVLEAIVVDVDVAVADSRTQPDAATDCSHRSPPRGHPWDSSTM